MASLDFPSSLQYSADHEWTERVEDSVVRVGITDFAQDALGDVVYVDLPEVGDTVTAGETCGEIESTKSVSDIISPVSGEVLEINEDLEDTPETVNSDPYSAGWLYLVRLNDPAELQQLMSAEDYASTVESEQA